MNEKRPIKRSIFVFGFGFITLLCLMLSIITYFSYTRSLYQSYNKRMDDILKYVESHIDNEDLSECVDSKVESEKYDELMSFMDDIMENFDIHYLYIVKPVTEDGVDVMMNILSADTAYGRETDPDGYTLGYMMYDVYEKEEIDEYKDAIEKDKISYFKNSSSWGYDYTAVKPLKNSEGEHFALLCVDIEVKEVQRAIQANTFVNIALILILGCIFILLFVIWMNRNITEPLGKLEKSVVAFAKRSHNQVDPDMLKYEEPKINTQNEVESLANAVTQMSEDMQVYARNVIDANVKIEKIKDKVDHMDETMFRDKLTRVKNRAWYNKAEKRLDKKILNDEAVFGIVLINLNDMNKINDDYGLERGNEYLTGACDYICKVFSHSPVIRMDGDEFVVILEGGDYEEIDMLIYKLKMIFDESSSDETKNPWERYSAAIGLAIYDRGTDKSVNEVLRRADELMYKNKAMLKTAKGSK